jgi:hypothetical protein
MGEHIFFMEELCMKKGKKFFAEAAALLLCASLFFIGCGSDDGEDPGPSGPAPLTGEKTTDEITAYLNDAGPYAFAGVVQSDGGTVYIPAFKNVGLVGEAAYTVKDGGVLIASSNGAVVGDGILKSEEGGLIISTEKIKEKNVDKDSLERAVALQILPVSTAIDLTGTVVAVKNDVAINDTATGASNILQSGLNGKTLYVIGKLTVSAAIGATPTKIVVAGNVEVDTAQDQAVPWQIIGNLDAKKLPTTGVGSLDVTGTATFAEAVSDITGAIKIGGTATFNNTAAFTAPVEFGGNVILGTEALTLSDAAAVVTLKAGKNINGVLVAGGKDVVLTPTATAVLTYTTDKIALTEANLDLTSGELSIPAGKEFSTAKEFKVGTALTVDGTLTVDGENGDVLLTDATTKVVLNVGSTLAVTNANGKFGEATPADTKITVAASSAPGTPTKAKSSADNTTWTITTEATTGDNFTDGKLPILGKLKIAIDGTSAVDGKACDSGDGAIGTLKAGEGTTITFTGTGGAT